MESGKMKEEKKLYKVIAEKLEIQYEYLNTIEKNIFGSFNSYLNHLTKYILKITNIETNKLGKRSNQELIMMILVCMTEQNLSYEELFNAIYLFRDYESMLGFKEVEKFRPYDYIVFKIVF